jgi:hypothetical protein
MWRNKVKIKNVLLKKTAFLIQDVNNSFKPRFSHQIVERLEKLDEHLKVFYEELANLPDGDEEWLVFQEAYVNFKKEFFDIMRKANNNNNNNGAGGD